MASALTTRLIGHHRVMRLATVKMKAWKFLGLQTASVHKVGVGEDAYWLAQISRQAKKRRALQCRLHASKKIYSVLHFKSHYEKTHGETSVWVAMLYFGTKP